MDTQFVQPSELPLTVEVCLFIFFSFVYSFMFSFRNKQLNTLKFQLNYPILASNYHRSNPFRLSQKRLLSLLHHSMMMFQPLYRQSFRQSKLFINQQNQWKNKSLNQKEKSKRNHLRWHSVHVLVTNPMLKKIKPNQSQHRKKNPKLSLHQKLNFQ